MGRLYSQPLRVYILLGVLALAGLVAGWTLPVSLFPNSAKPEIWVEVPYGALTGAEFKQTYGDDFEQALRGISAKDARIEKIATTYWHGSVDYDLNFTWGSDPDEAKKEAQSVADSFAARLPDDIRGDVSVGMSQRNAGFFALSFYSETRSLDELYRLLDGALKGRLATVVDAENPGLWNPSRKEVRVELKPTVMASLGLVPRDVEHAIQGVLVGLRGGSVTVGTDQLQIEMPRQASVPKDLGLAPIVTPAGKVVHVSDVARIDLAAQSGGASIVKTSGASSIILFATPKPGGNVKRMSEDLLTVVQDAMKSLPADIHYKVLVDPSSFIRSAVGNVFHEVAIGSVLAVAVLFVFIGSLKNVITAAIEIPLSIVLAFILMRITGVNINLISLGGLALSAGMNVDGSVVVMENIFRHFAEVRGQDLSFEDKLRVLTTAVAEVRLPIIASTLASLVVFLPLTFTSALSYAILGDLAKAVVFSHGFSALVALILVPTVRFQLLVREKGEAKPHRSPFEPALARLDAWYARALGVFMRIRLLKWVTYAGLAAGLAVLIACVLPNLPREVIGTPDSDMIFMSINTSGNTLTKQMEAQSDKVERDLRKEFSHDIGYTFTQINSPNHASILAHLTDKSRMREVWQQLEKRFTDTPLLKFSLGPWNPSELPIPNPPALLVTVRGGSPERRRDTAVALSDMFKSKHILDRVSTYPDAERAREVSLALNPEQWALLAQAGTHLTPGDLADISRVATGGRRIAKMSLAGQDTDVMLHYPAGLVTTPGDLGALPVGVGAKVVPLRALVPFRLVETPPPVYRENMQDLYLVTGRMNESAKSQTAAAAAQATQALDAWREAQAKVPEAKSADGGDQTRPAVAVEDGGADVTQAIHQLGVAIGISVLLIFLVLLLQFGSVVESLLVLVAVPLGFIGVLLALYVSGSTLSLNSALGVILLNGIAVNNSILMVDFIRRLSAEGLSPREAATQAARKRLRPILITSLTTILGMLPIALGMGDGGRILQPLGIAVSGGLWISMALTLFLVPSLQVSYLEGRQRRASRVAAAGCEPGDVAAVS